jgi:TetR/AcrR family transcriptional repressor of nem operon
MARTSDARERLLQATIDLIWTKSYGAVSVDDICHRADVRKGSFYHFFRSKDDLVIAALEEHWRTTVAPRMDPIFSAARPPLERLEAYFEEITRRQEERFKQYGRVVGCPYGALASEVAADSAIAATAKELLRRKYRYLESTLRDLKAEGLLPKTTNIGALTQSLWTFLEGALAQGRIRNELAPTKSLAAAAFQILGIDTRVTATR